MSRYGLGNQSRRSSAPHSSCRWRLSCIVSWPPFTVNLPSLELSRVRIGNPDPAHVSTSFVERQNLTMRMQMRRLTRLTNAFSKKLSHLKAAVALHFAFYNFCRVHSSLRVTPAMQSGLTDQVWAISELLDLPCHVI
jgi:hypothetical protein